MKKEKFKATREIKDGKMEIIEADIADAAEILKIQKQAFAQEAEIYGQCRVDPLRQKLEELEAEFDTRTVLTAKVDGGIVGAVRLELEEEACTVNKLSVLPAYQGRGIGRALLEGAEEVFPLKERFRLTTGSRSMKNIRLYEKLGYREYGRKRIDDQLEFVLMEKLRQS